MRISPHSFNILLTRFNFYFYSETHPRNISYGIRCCKDSSFLHTILWFIWNTSRTAQSSVHYAGELIYSDKYLKKDYRAKSYFISRRHLSNLRFCALCPCRALIMDIRFLSTNIEATARTYAHSFTIATTVERTWKKPHIYSIYNDEYTHFWLPWKS